jgi:hypothetical protein
MRGRRVALPVVIAIGGVMAVSALGAGLTRQGHPSRHHARSVAIVAHVIGLSGRQLFVKRRRRLVRLHQGSSVALGELVLLGPATKATFRMRLPPHARITPATYVMFMARFYRLPAPKPNRVAKEFGVIAYGVRTHHTVRLQPHYIEFAP